MLLDDESSTQLTLQSLASKRTTVLRLSTGLLQGFVLYWLYRASFIGNWAAHNNELYVPLLLVCGLIPILVISGLGHLSRGALIRWMLVAIIIVAGLGFYDFWRAAGPHDILGKLVSKQQASYPTLLVFIFTAVGLFIAQCLILAASQDQRRVAHYSSYFEVSWKLLIQIQFSVMFVAVLWLVLFLGAGLFKLVSIHFLANWIEQSWFSIPVTVFAFACAMHITDVRPAIVRGIRSLLLVLLSWVLPLTVILIGGFLVCLPFTGLNALWATRHATALLLVAAAVLITLINAAFQNGEVSQEINVVIRTSARIGAALLLPITSIAIYALFLRVHDYGWTTDRLIAAACLFIASAYTAGYVWATLQRGQTWLKPIARVNTYTSFLILALLLALFSPIADPARLSVSNQVQRLLDGKIKASVFDYTYLRFEGGRYGKAALEQLQQYASGPEAALIRANAKQALLKNNRWDGDNIEVAEPDADLKQNIKVWPKGTVLPDSFLRQDWKAHKNWQIPECVYKPGLSCSANLLDVTQDGKKEILLIGATSTIGSAILEQDEQGIWQLLSVINFNQADCPALSQELEAGRYRTIPKQLDDIQIGGQRIVIQPENKPALENCNAKP